MSQSKTLEGGSGGEDPPVPDVLRPAADGPPSGPPPERPAEREPVHLKDLGPLLEDALGRMERRAQGVERPIPLPWSNVSAALGGGFWGGTLVTLVGDTGSGKTQWALQAGLHAAESGFPVCHVAPDSGTDQVAARILALKAGERWADLYVGRTSAETLQSVRASHVSALSGLPFHIVGTRPAPNEPPDIRSITTWVRERYPEEHPGSRPFLVVLDFVQMVSGAGQDRDDLKEMMGRAASEARRAARDSGAVVLLVSPTTRETRREGDESIGIHRDRRQPAILGRGNPARLVPSGKDGGEAERESDTILVLAQEAWKGARHPKRWTKVWCAVARNRAGPRAWCALRFDGTRFDVEQEEPPAVPPLDQVPEVPEDEERSLREEE